MLYWITEKKRKRAQFHVSEQFVQVFSQMAMLFLIVAAGYAAKKVGWMDDGIDRGLSKLVLTVPLPAMILAATLDAESVPSLEQLGSGFVFSLVCYVIMIIAAFALTFILRIHRGNQGVFRYMMLFGNVGFIGYPVCSAIFGSESLIYVSIFQIPFNLLCFTLGIWFIAQDNDYGVKVKFSLKNFLSPCFVCCFAAVILTLLGVHSVPVLGETLSTLGSMTTPASLLIIGSSLANLPLKELIGGGKLWISSFSRLLVIPAAIWFVLHFFVSDPVLLGTLIVLCGMPVATNGTMFCYEYGGNAKTMAQATFITTVFSLVTIPVLMMLLG